jgi:polysaccharide biosynthesis transport protein
LSPEPEEKFFLNEERVGYDRLLTGGDQTQSPVVLAQRGGYPGYGDPYGYGHDEHHRATNDVRALLNEVWRAVRRRAWMIIAITCIVTFIVLLEMARVRPTYTASTIVEIRKEAQSLLVPVSDADPENIVGIKTKILMFSSRPLLEDVVRQQRLHENPSFFDLEPKKSHWQALKSLVGLDHRADPPPRHPAPALSPAAEATFPLDDVDTTELRQAEDARLDRYVSVLESLLKVEHIRETQALKISFTHPNPLISAQVANGLAQSFIKASFQNKTDKITNTSRALDRSTVELKDRMRQAEEALGRYSENHNIVSPSQIRLPADKLLRLHEQYMRASSELVVKQSLYDEVRQGRGSQLPESFTDPRIVDQQRKLNDLLLQASQLSLSYGPENPKVEAARDEIGKLREQIAESRTALDQKVATDYERALRETQTLKQALDMAKSEATSQDQASIQYNILKQDADTARALYNEFLRKASQAGLEVVEQQNNINVIRPARVPRLPDGLDPAIVVLLGLLLSMSGSLALAFVIEHFDNTIKNVNDVSSHVQLPTLGVIPEIGVGGRRLLKARKQPVKRITGLSLADDKEPAEPDEESSSYFMRFLPRSIPPEDAQRKLIGVDERSSIAEAYRSLRTSLLLSIAGNQPKTLLFTSGQPGEGKTSTVINTAISLAQLGSSVLIIDADLRKPAAHERFGINSAAAETPGLSTYLSHGIDDLDAVIQQLPVPGLSLLPSGPIPPNPAELISSPRLKEALKTLSERYDHLLIDSPPLMHVTDPVILSAQVDGVILVVHAGRSPSEVVRHCRQLVTNVGGKVLGVVLNKVNLTDREYRNSFYYHTSLEHREDDKRRISDILA